MSISTVLLRGLGPGGSPSALLTRGLVDPPDVIESALSEVSTVDSSLVGTISSELDLSESSSITDVISENLIAGGIVEEGSLVNDALTTSLYSELLINESSSADDSSIANTGSASNLTEASSLADSSSTSLQQYPGIVENSLLSDSLDTSTTVVRGLSESSLLSDNLTLTHEKNAAISENNAVNDDVTITSQAASVLSEEIPLTESLSVHVIKNNAVSESSTVLDTNAVGKTTYPIVSDSLNILENVSSRKVLATSISEGNSIVDALSEIRSHLANISENSITVDFSSSEQTGVVGIVETISVQDNLTIAGTWHIQLTEGSSVNSNEIGTGVVNLSVVENNAISDSLPLVTKAGYFDISESSVLEEVLSNTVALFDVIEESSYLTGTISTRQILTLLNFAISNLQDDVAGCRFKIPVSQDEEIQENVRKFYDTDFYIVDDLVAYSKGPSTYLTPVYVVGLADYCCYYNPDTSSLVLEQKDIFDDIWVEVDSIPISQVPESISFTFDQNGYPAIVWEQNRNIWLYWYDTLVSDTIISNMGSGFSPRIKIETWNEILQPVRTVILAYTSTGEELAYRRLNERYQNVHILENSGVKGIASLSHTARNSFKLSYVIDRGTFDYTLENYATARLGEWYGDNAAGAVEFVIDDFDIRSVILSPIVEENPIEFSQDINSLSVVLVPSVIVLGNTEERPLSFIQTISDLSVNIIPVVIRMDSDSTFESLPELNSEIQFISIALPDVRVDYEHEQDFISPLTGSMDFISISTEYTKATLLQAITAYSALTESLYTSDSWTNLETEIVAAQAIYDDAGATQLQIDTAGADLDGAYFSLVPDFATLTQLLLHFNGTDGSTTFTDSSGYTLSPSSIGSPASISTDQSLFGGSSFEPGSSTGYLRYATSEAFRLPGDFTIEAFVYLTNTTGNKYIVDTGISGNNNGIAVYITTGTIVARFAGSAILSTSGYSLNTWYHIAVTRRGNVVRLFVNGNLVSSNTSSATLNAGGMTIGNDFFLSGNFNGFIEEFRFVKGIALYTGNFNTPTSPFIG